MGFAFKSLLLVSAALPGSAAIAQTATQEPARTPSTKAASGGAVGNGLAEIVVTAQRRSENLQNVPVAVTALSADTLKATGATSVEDLNGLTPGLNITTTGGVYVLPRIRGVGTTAGGAGIENPVAVYVDGVYYASATGSLLSLNNVAQVAVLKGPQGTLFGRNATGGLIQITTRDPQQDFEADIEGTYGNKDTIGGSLYLTGGLATNIAADLAVYYRNQQDGFGVNRVTGKDVNRGRNLALRSKIKWDLSEDTTIKLAGDYTNNRAALVAFRPVSGTIPVGGVPFSSGKFDVESDADPLSATKQGGGSLTIQHDFSAVRALSITAYRRTRTHFILDSDKRPQPITTIDLVQNDRQFSQELQLVSTAGGPFQWTAGAYYFWAKGSYDPIQIIINNGVVRLTLPSEQTTNSIAAYAQGSYELAEGLKLTAGLRYTHDRQSFSGSKTTTTPAGTFPTASDSDSTTASKVTWRLAVDYRFSPELMGYLSHNRGFKSAGYNPQAFPAVPFEPEVLDAYEAGFKADLFDRKVRFNPSVFYYDYRNLQVSSFVNGILTISNAANAEIYGLDLDATAAITTGLTLSGGLSLLHARYKDFNGASISTPLPGGGNLITSGSAAGNRLQATPDWTLNLAVDYSIPVGENELQLHGDYYYNDGWYPEAENRVRQPSYNLFNASIAYVFNDQRYSARIWGRNLGNTAYALQMNSQAVGDAIGMAPGRTFGVTLGAKF
ncbi:TonB-dependent receptor [Novosphingobium endophyticum]|uniref:TonB-dependent receptor n=1 Tax=Novosphingobium endophyticum TaxID=1955250 RepID=A0A916X627_9SPHN|nr:TonB-dependent receptor [Novosphingobium endophyticum]GGC12929.1 TonB-dependent receptor [Novosphingobium endophyticum]